MRPSDRELMQQALKALVYMTKGTIHGGNDLTKAAIAALRERLAKPEREHLTDGQPCWCNPEVTEVDPVAGASVVVHKDDIADHAEQLARLGWQYFECPACGSEGARAFPVGSPIYVAEVTMPDPEDSPGYTEDEPTNVGCLGVPVNTPVTSPLKRGWQGLTKQEIDKIYRDLPHPVPDWQLSRAIEAKLRGKNT